ncbi:NUDIX domain-containing protein [Streptomyces phytophilus]|uniref:NUDIX domain-containing protein n=1 Tax=Streptomyces phytophilus TaxID=722715 RepID=UPI0015F0D6A7|nr:NUDIX hydrolase [Streptomyces phytophilus]
MTTKSESTNGEQEAHLAEGNAKQARKRVAADALFCDEGGRILIVKPTYKDAWDLPGGMAEANESPHGAANRELGEELWLTLPLIRVLVVDWVPPHGPWDDQLAFIFDGGILTAEQCSSLRPRDRELSAIKFLEPDHAVKMLQKRIARRAAQALKALEEQIPRYLENGRLL